MPTSPFTSKCALSEEDAAKIQDTRERIYKCTEDCKKLESQLDERKRGWSAANDELSEARKAHGALVTGNTEHARTRAVAANQLVADCEHSVNQWQAEVQRLETALALRLAELTTLHKLKSAIE